MLILTRHLGGSVYIGDEIKVTVLSLVGAQVRLGIAAPKDVAVHREEIHQRIQQEKKTQSGARPTLRIRRDAVDASYEFAVDHDQIGTALFEKPQQTWFGQAPNLLQIATFAGQQMMAARSEDKDISFELHYLGFVTKGFATMEMAISSAPRFAREILARLSQLIQFDSEASASYG